MNLHSCPHIERLQALVENRLSDGEAETLENHLKTCSACAEIVDKLDRQASGAFSFLYWDKNGTPSLIPHIINQAQDLNAGLINAPWRPPRQIGAYSIHQLIGQGGMGFVFAATHTLLKRAVAIKFIRARFSWNSDSIRQFQQEIEAAGGLIHPNIVVTHDAGEYNSMPFLVMEYLQGETLYEKVKREGPLPLEQAVNYILQAANGLEFANKRGLIHRDVKPENLWITPEGIIKVMDFGLAINNTLVSSQDLPNKRLCGTPDYMSPEQCLNDSNLNQQTDIYSLGCTLFFLLTGRAPFSGKKYSSLESKMNAHVRENLVPLKYFRDDTSEEFQLILNSMTAINRQARFGRMGDVIYQLQNVCLFPLSVENELPLSAPPIQKKKPNPFIAKLLRYLYTFFALTILACAISIFTVATRDSAPVKVKPNRTARLAQTTGTEVISSENITAENNAPIPAESKELAAETPAEKSEETKSEPAEESPTEESPTEEEADSVDVDSKLISLPIEELTRLADSGDSFAQNLLAWRYEFGKGVEQNDQKADEYYMKSALQNNPNGTFSVGRRYYYAGNAKLATQWLEKAANLGQMESQYLMAIHFFEGVGVEKNNSRAIMWLEKAVEQNYPQAINRLGACYLDGIGVKEEYSKAFEYFQKAAEMGEEDAIANLGKCYLNGWGTETDMKKAFDLFTQGAELNHPDAQFQLANCYKNGWGVTANQRLATKWYVTAANNGHAGAKLMVPR